MEKFVTVATFDFPADAETRKLLLEQEGIAAYLADDNLVGMSLYTKAIGGTKLQVAASNADRAREILEQYGASRADSAETAAEQDVTFACQECGKSITFPDERRGHVETCPSCGSYVDVPHATERSPLAATELSRAKAPRSPAEAAQPTGVSRTITALWIEVVAVLCLAYLPAMFGVFAYGQGWYASAGGSVYVALHRLVTAVEISLPLLVILSLGKDPWSLFGLVRPRWMADVVGGCAICLIIYSLPCFFILTRHPAPFDSYASLAHADGTAYAATVTFPLVLLSCAASAFAQELVMRGYLIARLERLLWSTFAAVVVTTLLFASYHLYQGVDGVVEAALAGLIYAAVFCSFRRLWPVCVAHAVHNSLVFLLTGQG